MKANKVYLKFWDNSAQKFKKEAVDVCRSMSAKSAVPMIQLHSPQWLLAGTNVKVQLGRRTAAGTVKSCRKVKSDFLLTVQVKVPSEWLLSLTVHLNNFDPGLLTVDKFITAEHLPQLISDIMITGIGGR